MIRAIGGHRDDVVDFGRWLSAVTARVGTQDRIEAARLAVELADFALPRPCFGSVLHRTSGTDLCLPSPRTLEISVPATLCISQALGAVPAIVLPVCRLEPLGVSKAPFSRLFTWRALWGERTRGVKNPMLSVSAVVRVAPPERHDTLGPAHWDNATPIDSAWHQAHSWCPAPGRFQRRGGICDW